jgi:osmotically-inducible protein OsmY
VQVLDGYRPPSNRILAGEITLMTIHDEALANRVRSQLAMDTRTAGLPISVRVSGGEIFLKGCVDTLEEVAIAEFIISGIPGVRHVYIDELMVKEDEE